MTIFIMAQCIGFIGYLFYISAPHFKTQKSIIQMDGCAYLLLCLQWFLLGQTSLLVLNMLAMITAILALHKQKHRFAAYGLYSLYPLGLLALWSASTGAMLDALVMCAFLCNVTSKTAQSLEKFRGFAALAGSLLTCTGAMALSIPAALFNCLFTAGHLSKLYSMHMSLDTEAKWRMISISHIRKKLVA